MSEKKTALIKWEEGGETRDKKIMFTDIEELLSKLMQQFKLNINVTDLDTEDKKNNGKYDWKVIIGVTREETGKKKRNKPS